MQLHFPSGQQSPQQKSQLLSFKQKGCTKKKYTHMQTYIVSLCIVCKAILLVCLDKKKNI